MQNINVSGIFNECGFVENIPHWKEVFVIKFIKGCKKLIFQLCLLKEVFPVEHFFFLIKIKNVIVIFL